MLHCAGTWDFKKRLEKKKLLEVALRNLLGDSKEANCDAKEDEAWRAGSWQLAKPFEASHRIRQLETATGSGK